MRLKQHRAYGLLPAADSDGYEDPDQDIPMFNETQTVTREFAAYTAVKALGFTGDFELNCDDSAALKYTSEDAIAIKQGMLSLENNCFKPESPLTEQDKNSIFAVFTKVATTSDLSNVTQTESTVYADGVIQGSLNSVTDYTVVYNDDNTITVTVPDNTATSAIQTGDVFVLPSTQQCVGGIALKAISSQKNGDNIVLECSRPEMAETYSHIGFTGNVTPEVGNITTGTGVTYSYSEDTQEQDVEYGSFSYGGSTAIPGDLTFYTDIKDGLPYNGSINGYVTIKIPDVTAKVDGSVGWTGIDIDDFIISVTEKTVISMDIKTSVSQGDDDTFLPAVPGDGNGGGSTKHELGHIPIALGATGLSVDIVPILNVDIYGRASIDFSMTTTAGFQYVNGTPRIIADGTSSLDNLAISATAKFGVGAGVHLKAASVFDLIGFDLHGGIGLNASFTAHPEVTPVLYCSDAACYMYLDLDLNSDTIVGGLIKMACGDVSWYIFTEDNSPLKKIVHLENGKKVNACTFAPGALHGYVASADNNAPIENARVSIYKGDQLIYSGFTNAFGVYDLTSINSGTYTVRVAATGYAAYTSSITVETGRTAYAENLLLIDREHSGEGTVKGLIKNAVTGNAVTDVKYTVYKNWDVTSGDKLAEATSDDGNYVVTLPAGNYTVVFEKDGFVTANVNITVQENEAVVKDAAMSPVGGNISIGDNIIRCVLTWGLTPRDLDSHLFGPTVNGTSTFHTYYVNKNYREAGEMIANLDLDDTTSYGPETTTVYKKNTEGTYSYFVHDYTNRWTDRL